MPQSEKSSIRIVAAAATLVALGALGVRGASFFVPESDWDEYMFALVGREILHGHLPFSTIFDNKPAGLYYVFAAAEFLFGPTVAAIRSVALAAALGTASFLFASLRGWGSRAAAMGAACFLALSLSNGGLSAMSELVALPFLVAALYAAALWSRGRRGPAWAGARMGICFGLAAQVSYLSIPVAGALGLAFLLAGGRRGLPAMLLASVVAFALVLVPQALRGLVAEYFSLLAAYHRSYQAHEPFARQLLGLAPLFAKFLLPLATVLLPFVASRDLGALRPASGGDRALVALLAAGAIGGLVAVLVSGRFYGHYFLLSLPFLAGLAAFAIGRARERWIAGTALLALAACGALALRVGLLVRSWSGHPYFPSVVAGEVAKHAGPNEPIFVFNATHGIYFLADRPVVGRFVFPDHYLQKPNAVALGISESGVIEDALRAKPRVVVVGTLVPTPSARWLAEHLPSLGYSEVALIHVGEDEARIFTAGVK